MKKCFVMLLSAAIAFGSCACGGETTEKTEEKAPVKTDESVPHRTGDEIVGVSDKDVNDLDVTFRDSIREDSTGNWRLAMASTSEDFLSYAASYYKNYVEYHRVDLGDGIEVVATFEEDTQAGGGADSSEVA